MNTIASTLEALQMAPPQACLNLSLFPLLSPEPLPQGYFTLDEALEQGAARVTELTEAGVVPELRFDNLSERPVLLLDGEELVGARQNRVLNISILVGGFARIVIPVSCVEQGRWHHLSREFRSGKRHLYARARAAKMEQVSHSMRMNGSRRSNQHAVWEGIAAKSMILGCMSDTEAMADIYEHESARLEGFEKAFRPLERQVGAVFAINGRILGVELFDSAEVFAKVLARLVGSYAMDAIEEPDEKREPPAEAAVRDFLSRIRGSDLQSFPAVGEGQDLRLHGRGVSGGALVADGRLVHLSAFFNMH